MDFENNLKQFADKYKLNFMKQKFENCFNGGWTIMTYSIYNNTGCFTVHYLLQRMELDFYISDRFYTDRKKLCQTDIDIYSYEKNIWQRKSKILFLKNPFFYNDPNKVISTLVDIMEVQAKKENIVFNIKL